MLNLGRKLSFQFYSKFQTKSLLQKILNLNPKQQPTLRFDLHSN